MSTAKMRASAVRFVVEQHAEELATLWATRDGLAANGHVRLRELARFDDRIAAHEDGCVIAGQSALQLLTAELANVSAGRVFALVLAALELNDRATMSRCLTLAEASPDAYRGVSAALAWVSASRLTGVVKDLFAAQSSAQRRLGLAACRAHGVNPGRALSTALSDDDEDVRAEGARVGAALGQVDMVRSLLLGGVQKGDTQFWVAWSAVLSGDRNRALQALTIVATSDGPNRKGAFRLACQTMGVRAAHDLLRELADDPVQSRWLIEGSGIAGDPAYVPWLVRRMAQPKTARVAGESFSLITGVDLTANKLNAPAPDNVESGPNDEPDDPNVEMDADEGLPWPDVPKIEQWWAENGGRFQKGGRYFMGAPVTREHCIDVLKTGYQRQRILAAHYLCLLDPGTPLFNTSAPAWRQQRWLAKMA